MLKITNEHYAHTSTKDDGSEISFEHVWLQTMQWNLIVGLYPEMMMKNILFKTSDALICTHTKTCSDTINHKLPHAHRLDVG